MIRTTICGVTVEDVLYHEHELRCTGCLRIDRDRYKAALEKIQALGSVSTSFSEAWELAHNALHSSEIKDKTNGQHGGA